MYLVKDTCSAVHSLLSHKRCLVSSTCFKIIAQSITPLILWQNDSHIYDIVRFCSDS